MSESDRTPVGQSVSRELLEATLLSIRDGAQATLSEFAAEAVIDGARHGAKIADARAVWHASEIALGMLRTGYMPKREAVEDVAARLTAWEGK